LYIYSVLYTTVYIYSVPYTTLYIYNVLYTTLYIYNVLYTTLYIYNVLYTTVYIYSLLSLSLARTYESKGFWPLSMGTGTKEDKLRTGRVWASVFHHVMARSLLDRVLKLMNLLFN
jgi:hypothetical protein